MTDEMTRGEKTMLYVIGTLNDLRSRGLVAGGFDLSTIGNEAYKSLVASGFKPTDEEITDVMIFLTSNELDEELDANA